MMPRIRLSFVVLLFSLPVFAQMPVPRFTGPISDANKTVLAHSRTPRVQAGQDLGPVEPDMLIPGITLVFRRSADQEAALQQLLTEQQTRGSRFYHQGIQGIRGTRYLFSYFTFFVLICMGVSGQTKQPHMILST